MTNYVIITDDEGNKKAFYNFDELIKYLDSFKMSFLPDGFSYTIHEETKDEQETRLGEYPGPPEPLAMAQGSRPKLQASSGKLQAPSCKLDKIKLQCYSIL